MLSEGHIKSHFEGRGRALGTLGFQVHSNWIHSYLCSSVFQDIHFLVTSPELKLRHNRQVKSSQMHCCLVVLFLKEKTTECCQRFCTGFLITMCSLSLFNLQIWASLIHASEKRRKKKLTTFSCEFATSPTSAWNIAQSQRAGNTTRQVWIWRPRFC